VGLFKEEKMSRVVLKGLIVIVLAMFVYGCGTTGVKVRRYIEEKARVDQEMQGNAGYLSGTPQSADRSQMKKTRKIYVLEILQGAEGDDLESVEGESRQTQGGQLEDSELDATPHSSEQPSGESPKTLSASFGVVIAPTDEGLDERDSSQQATSFVDYTVEKDDTLQKISKKFYDSYSKWPKIYEANKDKIESPDNLKPGIVIKIPMDKL
jgi:LysM repeat protein